MAGKVDVLAVLDEVLRRTEAAMPTPLDLPGESRMCPEHHAGYVHDIREARAAVAELIEATASYSAARGMKPVHVVNAKLSRVRAALARIGGA